nr:hypothetical protein Iba_chr07dCG7260 [Ipomoea batatas]
MLPEFRASRLRDSLFSCPPGLAGGPPPLTASHPGLRSINILSRLTLPLTRIRLLSLSLTSSLPERRRHVARFLRSFSPPCISPPPCPDLCLLPRDAIFFGAGGMLLEPSWTTMDCFRAAPAGLALALPAHAILSDPPRVAHPRAAEFYLIRYLRPLASAGLNSLVVLCVGVYFAFCRVRVSGFAVKRGLQVSVLVARLQLGEFHDMGSMPARTLYWFPRLTIEEFDSFLDCREFLTASTGFDFFVTSIQESYRRFSWAGGVGIDDWF